MRTSTISVGTRTRTNSVRHTMAKWLPPIPSGALWSPQAVALGPALPLLAWCYDVVQTDGWAEINLHHAAGDIGVPYPTIKRWWGALRGSEFFLTVDDRGRAGMRAQFADEWLDRRILSARETGSEVIPNSSKSPDPNTENGTETGSEMIPNTEQDHETDQKRAGNGTETGSLLIAYMNHDDHESCIAQVANAPALPPSKKQKRGRATATQDDTTPAIVREALATACAADSGRMLARVNVAAKAIWARQQARGISAEQTAAGVPQVAAYLRRCVYPYTTGQPLTPEAFDDRWAAAAEDARQRRSPPLTTTATTYQPPADALKPDELARRIRAQRANQ